MCAEPDSTYIIKTRSISKDIHQDGYIRDHATRVYYHWGTCVPNPRKSVRNACVRPFLIGLSPGRGLTGVFQVTCVCALLTGEQVGEGMSTHGCVASDWSSTDQ